MANDAKMSILSRCYLRTSQFQNRWNGRLYTRLRNPHYQTDYNHTLQHTIQYHTPDRKEKDNGKCNSGSKGDGKDSGNDNSSSTENSMHGTCYGNIVITTNHQLSYGQHCGKREKDGSGNINMHHYEDKCTCKYKNEDKSEEKEKKQKTYQKESTKECGQHCGHCDHGAKYENIPCIQRLVCHYGQGRCRIKCQSKYKTACKHDSHECKHDSGNNKDKNELEYDINCTNSYSSDRKGNWRFECLNNWKTKGENERKDNDKNATKGGGEVGKGEPERTCRCYQYKIDRWDDRDSNSDLAWNDDDSDYSVCLDRFREDWYRSDRHRHPSDKGSGDGQCLYQETYTSKLFQYPEYDGEYSLSHELALRKRINFDQEDGYHHGGSISYDRGSISYGSAYHDRDHHSHYYFDHDYHY